MAIRLIGGPLSIRPCPMARRGSKRRRRRGRGYDGGTRRGHSGPTLYHRTPTPTPTTVLPMRAVAVLSWRWDASTNGGQCGPREDTSAMRLHGTRRKGWRRRGGEGGRSTSPAHHLVVAFAVGGPSGGRRWCGAGPMMWLIGRRKRKRRKEWEWMLVTSTHLITETHVQIGHPLQVSYRHQVRGICLKQLFSLSRTTEQGGTERSLTPTVLEGE